MAFKDWLILVEGPHGIDVAGKRSPDAAANLTDSPLHPAVIDLLDMHHQPGQVHAIMEHHSPTLLLQFL